MSHFHIIGGKHKGRKLDLPPAIYTRPTPMRVREALFNCLFSLDFSLVGARVLDGFAGSGAIGLECLSRGAQHVVFVENNSDVMQTLTANIAKISPAPTHVARDFQFLTESPFDFVFLDPPYGACNDQGIPLYEDALHALKTYMHPHTLCVVETETGTSPHPLGFKRIQHKIYGRVELSFFHLTHT